MNRLIAPPQRLAMLALAAVLALPAVSALANSPDLNIVRPAGWQRGKTTEITLRGRRLDDPKQVVFHDEGIEVLEITPENHEKRDDRRVKVKIRIAKDARLGEHKVRLRTRRGWTDLRTFYVGDDPVADEEEDNSSFDDAQPIELGRTVHGVVKNEDVDYYRVEAKKGQRISAEAEAIRLGGPMFDPHVAILDARKFALSANDDTALLKQDAYASATAPTDGTYYIRIREAAYGGGGNNRYRLHVGTFPRPKVAYPMGGQAGEYVDLTFIGDVAGEIEQEVKLPSKPGSRFGAFAKHGGQVAPSPNPMRVSSFPNVLESEPNNNYREATRAEGELPQAFNGILQEDGDRDWFRFQGKKNQRLEIRTFAREYGAEIDPVINLYKVKPDGGLNHLEGNDDAGDSLDPVVRQKLPSDGEYVIRVRDKLEKGGAAYAYRVEATRREPSMELFIPDVRRRDSQSRQFVSVPRGNRWGIIIRADRQNFGGPIDIAAENLPEGVTMHAPRMPGNVNRIPIVFEAEEDADLTGTLADLKGQHAKNDKITGSYRHIIHLVRGNPNRTPYYSTRVEKLAAGVTDKAPYSIEIVQPKVPLVRHGRMNLKIKVHREEGFNNDVVVQLPFRPPGMGARSKIKISGDENEGTYPISANGRASKNTWPIMAVARAGVDGGPLYVSSQLADLEIADPIARGKILMTAVERGDDTEIVCQLDHKTSFEGKAEVQLRGLPNNVSVEQQTQKITKDTEEVVWAVSTNDDAPIGKHKSLNCRLRLVQNGEAIRQTVTGGGVLRIDKPRKKNKDKEKDEQKKKEKKEQKKEKEPEERLTRLEKLRKQLAEQEDGE